MSRRILRHFSCRLTFTWLTLGSVCATAQAQQTPQTDPAAVETESAATATNTPPPPATAPAPVQYELRPIATESTEPREPNEPENESAFGIFLNPLYMAFGRYEGTVAYSPTHLIALNFTGMYYDRKIGDIETKAYGGDVGIQFLLSGKKPMHGAYVYPRVVYYSAEATDGSITVDASIYGTSVTGGYQWNWQPFSLRIGGGIVYYKASGSENDSGVNVSLNGAAPVLDALIGLVF
jgi:hypothetical protein